MIRIRPTKPHSMDRARTTAHKPFPVSVCVQLRPAKKPSSLPRWVAASCLALAFSGGILVADAIAQPIDLGDAPDPSYPTLLASGGASHVLGGRAYLGACVDGEADGQPSAGAVGDDDGTGDPVFGTCVEGDEDGVFFTSALANGTTAGVDVLAADGCTLSAWIDWNGDGDWADPGEDLFPGGQAVASGVNSLSVAVPMTAAEGTTYARFRCTTAGVVLATGPAPDGEVEDYEVTVGPADDYGDAPAPYPTLAADSGPVHALGGPYLGTCVDTEADGQPSDVNPGGDDVNVGDPAVGSCVLGDDEDGVVFTAVLTPGTSPGVDVRASAACTLSGWIDWNGDGDWADTGETVFPGTALNAGVNSLSVVVPAAATTGPTWGRFRCTTDGAVAVTGAAADGEVEDYPLTVGPTSDYGDAPDPSYPTLGGASHVLGGVVWLGACVDGEADGQPSAVADGDDHAAGNPVFGSCAGGDDEDGVVFTSVLVPGESATVDVTASASCTLSAWIDWNGDGDWADVDEELFVESWPVLVAGVNNLGFDVPLTATSGLTHARFRCASSGPLSVDGAAADGEVEDHLVAISDLDFGDAPDPAFPTLLASDGARHAVGFGSNVWLGNCVDAETDGQPTAAANGDDDDDGTPFGACVAGDDEDGVTFTSTFFEGGGAGSVDVVAASACTLSAWVDWTGDGDWLDPGEDLFPGGQAIEMGLTSLGFAVPATAVAGTTTARFRCTTGGAVSFTGLAADGEVEDYQVTVEAALDFGDAPVVWNGGGFATLGSLAARHVLAGGVYLGACVDAETGGQAVDVTPGGDDANAGPRIDGTCTGGDDEDGVVFTTPLIPDQTANVDVTAAATCNLSAWIDWNSDGDWNDGGEKVFNDEALGAGINALSVPVPAGAAIGTAWARFRCTTAAGVNYYSQAADGEVEDYALTVGNPVDFGDAPDPSYPTLAASSGASHLLDGTVYLGLCVDAESDGQPSAAAAGDDLGAGNPVFGTCAGVSDEDGVVFTSLLTGGSSADVDVTASAACTLSAWIDFNHNGDFSDAEDDLFVGGTLLSAGVNNLTFPVPAGAVAGITVARFRCTTDGAVSFTGQAGDGEVEDHLVEITGIDYGDAPDPTYPTYLANDGARHLLGGLTFLGGCVDADLGGQPSAGADGDDLDAGGLVAGSCVNDDDEDGVLFLEPLAPGTNVDVDVLAAAPCTLSAWIDWNGDGDWIDTGEELFPGGAALGFGANLLSVAVPGAATPGTTFARFRCTTDGPVAFTGPATDGEVEDYQVKIGDALDFGDAPDPAYPTLAAADGARHVLGSGVYLGFCVDAEADGQQSADVLGDDTGVGSPIFGACAGNDDEDGVTFTTLLVTDTTADVVVRASAACTLSAWIDFDQSGGWTAGEELFPGGVALAAGLNPLSFSVPAAAAAGTTAARFRCTTDGAVSYTGQAADGEVEDYEVSISDLDYGDAPDPLYPTLLASGGARHVVTGGLVFLGECVDAEADAQPTATADGDDTAVGDPVVLYPDVLTCDDDEDGVTFTTPLYADTSAGVTVHVNDPCTLSAWIDWNGDGDWDDPGEDLFPGGEFLEVTTNLSFEVPADAAGGTTFARFRCTTDGPVTPTGLATDGEVEDYEVEVPAPIDWGDAQDSPYPTLEASDGARHVLGSGVYLGECVDAEVDGQEHASFRRDDQWTSNFVVGDCTHGDDEDGVKFTSLLLVDETADVEVTASAACTLSAWIDWNADGDWDEPDEELFPGGRALTAGLNTLSVTVPATAPTGETGARFRCTTDGPVSYTGQASDGEVEDYKVPIGATTDYGDAPDPTYPTLEASSGASHLIGDLYLGSCVDGESDGLPSDSATGDDVNDGIPVFGDCTGNDDEDGVVFKSLLVANQTADFEVTASGPCNLTAWIDWNRDGDWGEANEELFPGGTALAAGLNPLSVSVPSGAGTGDTYARFRCTTDGAAPITGQAADGEVEDYKVTLGDVPDFGDARSPYPTRFADGGAFHLLGSGVYLGACVDAETDGQRDNNAEGDDENAGNPVFGTCVDGDDEDGVVFITALTIGATADIEVTASADCTLSAWIDWNGDGDWSEADEELFPPDGVALSAGLNPLSFAVPDAGGEIAETTYARFRCTTDGSVHFTGEAADGEVEDYRVTLEPPNADLSITKTGSSGAVMPGATLTYTIAVTNAGPLAAPDVQVTDTLPEEGVSFLSTSGCAEDPAGVPVCSLGTIEAAGEKQYTITVEIMSPSTGGIITNVANVESAIEDPDPENNQAIEDTLIDLDPPTVTQVAAGAEIVECGEVRSALSALLVSFSEPMLDPPDDVDPDDVTNPANYLLVAAGPDQDLSTSFCGPALDDDEAIAIDLVTYDDVTLTATLDLAGSLNDSLYRLLVCGSTSIRDLAGYLLDGTGNGIGGDDFVRTWRVERGNILSNGYFDCTLDSWVGVSTVPEEIAHSPDDFDDSSASGSAQVTNLSASIDFSLGQCVDVNLPSVPFCPFEARVRLDAEPGVSLLLSKTCEFFSEAACAGFSMASNSTLSFIADTAGGWEIVGFSIRPPEAAASALCSFDLSTPTAEDFNIYYDEVRLTCASLIFEDGFESGDTSQWSSAVP